MKLLVFGKTGQVAQSLQGNIPSDVSAKFLSRSDVDLSDFSAVRAAIVKSGADAVINAAAYTAVDKAESERALAFAVNADAPKVMSEACREMDVPLVQLSTDYVYSGEGVQPYRPSEPTIPRTVYGQSKAEGDANIVATSGNYAILRCSWVFSPYGANFLKTMLRLGQIQPRLRVVNDQVGGPTPAKAIAVACIDIAKDLIGQPKLTGIYHFSGYPDVSWADFAREIMRAANLGCDIEDIFTKDYPSAAVRPLNSRLDCAGLAKFNITRPDWRVGLADCLDILKGR